MGETLGAIPWDDFILKYPMSLVDNPPDIQIASGYQYARTTSTCTSTAEFCWYIQCMFIVYYYRNMAFVNDGR